MYAAIGKKLICPSIMQKLIKGLSWVGTSLFLGKEESIHPVGLDHMVFHQLHQNKPENALKITKVKNSVCRDRTAFVQAHP